MTTIWNLVNRAAHNRTTFYVNQQSGDLRRNFPFGDMDAIIKFVEAEGLEVSNVGATMILVHNTAWLTVWGVIKPI